VKVILWVLWVIEESTKGVRYVFEVHQLFFISFLGFAKSMDKSRID
jgi:hypothetical protein